MIANQNSNQESQTKFPSARDDPKVDRALMFSKRNSQAMKKSMGIGGQGSLDSQLIHNRQQTNNTKQGRNSQLNLENSIVQSINSDLKNENILEDEEATQTKVVSDTQKFDVIISSMQDIQPSSQVQLKSFENVPNEGDPKQFFHLVGSNTSGSHDSSRKVVDLKKDEDNGSKQQTSFNVSRMQGPLEARGYKSGRGSPDSKQQKYATVDPENKTFSPVLSLITSEQMELSYPTHSGDNTADEFNYMQRSKKKHNRTQNQSDFLGSVFLQKSIEDDQKASIQTQNIDKIKYDKTQNFIKKIKPVKVEPSVSIKRKSRYDQRNEAQTSTMTPREKFLAKNKKNSISRPPYFGHVLTNYQVQIQNTNVEAIEKQASVAKQELMNKISPKHSISLIPSQWIEQQDGYGVGITQDSLMESTIHKGQVDMNKMVNKAASFNGQDMGYTDTHTFGEESNSLSREFDIASGRQKGNQQMVPKIKLNIIEESPDAKFIKNQIQLQTLQQHSAQQQEEASSVTCTINNPNLSIFPNEGIQNGPPSILVNDSPNQNRLVTPDNFQAKTFDQQSPNKSTEREPLGRSIENQNQSMSKSNNLVNATEKIIQLQQKAKPFQPLNIDKIINETNPGDQSNNHSNNHSPRIIGKKSDNGKSRMSIFSLNVSRENKEQMINQQAINNCTGSAGLEHDQRADVKTLKINSPKESLENNDSQAADSIPKSPMFSPVDSIGSSIGDLAVESKMSVNSPLKVVMIPQYEPGLSQPRNRLGTTQPKSTRPVNFNKESQLNSPRQSQTIITNHSSQIQDVKRILDNYQIELPPPGPPPKSQNQQKRKKYSNQDLQINQDNRAGNDSPQYQVPQIVNIDFRDLQEMSPSRSRESDDGTSKNIKMIKKQKVAMANKGLLSPKNQGQLQLQLNSLKSPKSPTSHAVSKSIFSPKGSIRNAPQDTVVFNMIKRCNISQKSQRMNQQKRQIFSQDIKHRNQIMPMKVDTGAGENNEFFKERNARNVNKLKSEINTSKDKDVVKIPMLRLNTNEPNECKSHRMGEAARRMTLLQHNNENIIEVFSGKSIEMSQMDPSQYNPIISPTHSNIQYSNLQPLEKSQFRYSKYSKAQKSNLSPSVLSKPKTYRDRVSKNYKQSKKLKIDNIQQIKTYLDAMKVEKSNKSNMTTSRNYNHQVIQNQTFQPRKHSENIQNFHLKSYHVADAIAPSQGAILEQQDSIMTQNTHSCTSDQGHEKLNTMDQEEIRIQLRQEIQSVSKEGYPSVCIDDQSQQSRLPLSQPQKFRLMDKQKYDKNQFIHFLHQQQNDLRLETKKQIEHFKSQITLLDGNQDCMKIIRSNNQNIIKIIEEFQSEIKNIESQKNSKFKTDNRQKMPLFSVNKLNLSKVQNKQKETQNNPEIDKLLKLQILHEQIQSQQRTLQELQELENLTILIKNERFKKEFQNSDDNSKGTGIDYEAMEILLKEKLKQSFTNIIVDLEKHENERSQHTKFVTKDKSYGAITLRDESKSTSSPKRRFEKYGTQESRFGKVDQKIDEKDVEVLKSKINIEFQKYNEFAKEAKQLGLDLDVLQAKTEIIGPFKQDSQGDASYGSPKTIPLQSNMNSNDQSPFFEQRQCKIIEDQESKETTTGQNTNINNTPEITTPQNEDRLLSQTNIIDIKENGGIKKTPNSPSHELDSSQVSPVNHKQIYMQKNESDNRLEAPSNMNYQNKSFHSNFYKDEIKNGRDETEYLNNTVKDYSQKDEDYKMQPSVNSINDEGVATIHSNLQMPIKNHPFSHTKKSLHDTKKSFNDLNITAETVARNAMSPTPPENIKQNRDTKNSSAISVCNIKPESEKNVESSQRKEKTPISDLVLTTESDQNKNQEMLQIIDDIDAMGKNSSRDRSAHATFDSIPQSEVTSRSVWISPLQQGIGFQQNKLMSPESTSKFNYLKKFSHGQPVDFSKNPYHKQKFSSIVANQINQQPQNIFKQGTFQLGIQGSRINNQDLKINTNRSVSKKSPIKKDELINQYPDENNIQKINFITNHSKPQNQQIQLKVMGKSPVSQGQRQLVGQFVFNKSSIPPSNNHTSFNSFHNQSFLQQQQQQLLQISPIIKVQGIVRTEIENARNKQGSPHTIMSSAVKYQEQSQNENRASINQSFAESPEVKKRGQVILSESHLSNHNSSPPTPGVRHSEHLRAKIFTRGDVAQNKGNKNLFMEQY